MKKVALILAGGNGNRLYPLSQQDEPKQFLKLYNDSTLIENTIRRIKEIDEIIDIYIVTNESQKKIMLDKLGKTIKKKNIIFEPEARNTSACIGLACMEIKKKYSDCILCVFSADHYIKDEGKFCKLISRAMGISEKNSSIVTLGIKPTFPSTEFGYIKVLEHSKNKIMKIDNFVEKPNEKDAKKYLDSGMYLWNSGIFIWKISTLLNLYKIHLPDILATLNEIYKNNKLSRKKLFKLYPNIRSISIDRGIMEKKPLAYVLECNVGWLDIGRLNYLDMILEKNEYHNYFNGNVYVNDSNNCTVYSDNDTIALVGVDDLIVIKKNDITLICKKDSIDKIGDMQKELESKENK